MEFVSIVPGVMALYSLTSDLDTALSAPKLVENPIFVLTFKVGKRFIIGILYGLLHPSRS